VEKYYLNAEDGSKGMKYQFFFKYLWNLLPNFV